MCTGRFASRRSGPAGRRLRNRAGGIRGSESSHLSLKIYITAAPSAVFHGYRRAESRPDAGRHAPSPGKDCQLWTGCCARSTLGDEWYRPKLRSFVHTRAVRLEVRQRVRRTCGGETTELGIATTIKFQLTDPEGNRLFSWYSLWENFRDHCVLAQAKAAY